MKTFIFSIILCFITLQIFPVPNAPGHKAIKITKQKHIFRPQKIIAPSIDEDAIVFKLPNPRCGGFMKRNDYYCARMFVRISNFSSFTHSLCNSF